MFVRKLLERRILISDGEYYELSEEFVRAFEAYKQTYPLREAVARTIREMDDELNDEELREAGIFVEGMIKHGEVTETVP